MVVETCWSAKFDTPAKLAASLDVGRLAVLVGAGVSVPGPSNLLPGAAFVGQIVNRVAPFGVPRTWLSELMSAPPGRHRPGETLRFEALMGALVSSGIDPELSVLDCLERCEAPNDGHVALAALLRNGAVVMTTNFDSLIEQAYGDGLGVAAYDHDFPVDASWRRGPATLWKLHGSLRVGERSARDSVQATLARVLAPAMSQRKRRFLQAVLAERDLLVVGYSGADDFDIVPVLEDSPSPRRLIWIDHVGGADRVSPVADDTQLRFPTDITGRDRVRFRWDPDGREIRSEGAIQIGRADTGAVLRALSPNARATALEHRFGAPFPEEVRGYFDRWQADLRGPGSARLALLAQLLELREHHRRERTRLCRVRKMLQRSRVRRSATAAERTAGLAQRFAHDCRDAAGVLRRGRAERIRDELEREVFPAAEPEIEGTVLRLLAEVTWALHGPHEGAPLFEHAATTDARAGRDQAELETLLSWLFHDGVTFVHDLFPRTGKVPPRVPAEALEVTHGTFSHERLVRVHRLALATGDLADVWRLALHAREDLVDDDLDLLADATAAMLELQRVFVDLGDVRGEARATLTLARQYLIGAESWSRHYAFNAADQLVRAAALSEYADLPEIHEAAVTLRSSIREWLPDPAYLDRMEPVILASLWSGSRGSTRS